MAGWKHVHVARSTAAIGLRLRRAKGQGSNVGEICKELHLVDANKSLTEAFFDEGVSGQMTVDGWVGAEGWAGVVTI